MNDPLIQMKEEQGRSRRGRLKVYLGMAAGVGKTYGMLSEAQEELSRHTDVVIGYLEPHGRVETETLAEGLPTVPPLLVEHRGVTLKEFDLEAALARKPALVLVDELAHSNPPGSKHSKRWQDIQELLQAGINVATTVNIQHIESLRDVVAKITGVFVQETVPDAFFEEADEIELVDISPEQLHQRLKDGKVYDRAKVEQALDGFFKKANLLALRELSLRHTAEQVDKDLREARAGLQELEPWHAGERILVCVAPNAMAAKVVRAARRLAASLHAEMLAVSVDSSRQRTVSPRNREYQEQALQLAEKLGAKTANLAGDDIVVELLNYARNENATTIVMGKPIRAKWKEVLFGSVVNETIRSSGDIDILVVTGSESAGTPIYSRTKSETANWRGYAEAVAIIALCTLIGWVMPKDAQLSNLVLLYLLGVVVVSLRNGIRESLVATFLSVCAFNFFFVDPLFTFEVADFRFVFTFAAMATVSALLSALTTRLRESTKAGSIRERNTATLYSLSRRLAESRKKEDMARLVTEKATQILGYPTAVLVRTDYIVKVLTPSDTHFEHSENERAVAAWVVEHGQPAGYSTDTLAGARGYYVPLVGSMGTLGALGIEFPPESAVETSQKHLIEAIADQLAGAMERAQFAKERHESAIHAETEQMRSDLLSAVSHDLRTPLASIQGSAASLLMQPGLGETSKELATTIQEESQRMARQIQNLLDMTRVQGQVKLNLDWQSLEDLANNAIERTASLFDVEVAVEKPSSEVLVRVDGVLIEQVIVNLLENAARHAGPSVQIAVRISKVEDAAILEVSDNGPGFEDGEETRAFERFHRRGKSGFGLGLAICKAAVEAHGGTISAKNLKPGASIRITLPMEKSNV